MAQELQYTSVPQGLKAGSRGFCVVVMTRGMSNPVAERLESLSGYDMFYKVGHPNIDLNPAQYAHWIVELEGKPAHVLSYVGYAGMDFNGRANKFAHHVRLEDRDLSPGGPAWMVLNQGAMTKTFVPPTRTIEPRTMPRGDTSARECENWIRATGDGGWAGTLAQQVFLDPTKAAYVIYPIMIDPLPLILEAAALLPVELRWQATFSSYFTRVPADVTCAWRFCLEGTDAAREARAAAGRALVIDLVTGRKRAPDSAMATLARKAPPKFNPALLNQEHQAHVETAHAPEAAPHVDHSESIPLPPASPPPSPETPTPTAPPTPPPAAAPAASIPHLPPRT